MNSEYVTQLYKTEQQGTTTDDRGLTRLDVTPGCAFRSPSGRSSPSTRRGVGDLLERESRPHRDAVPDSIDRRYFDLSSTLTGPVFNRIWDTPRRTYAQKFKHVVEPIFTM